MRHPKGQQLRTTLVVQRNREIRRLKAEGVSAPELAKQFGLTRTTILAICRGPYLKREQRKGRTL